VGFNNKGFDDQVISAYFPEISKVNSFDILEVVANRLGFRVKLDNLAHATLGVGKSGDGLQAIEYYRQGKIEELRQYCLDDVKITQQLYEAGQQYGRLYYSDLQGKKEVLVDFTPPRADRKEALNLSLF
jgi:DEAD/DEAH box helicase domain-containing protein